VGSEKRKEQAPAAGLLRTLSWGGRSVGSVGMRAGGGMFTGGLRGGGRGGWLLRAGGILGAGG